MKLTELHLLKRSKIFVGKIMQSGICNYTFRCYTIGKKTHQHSSRIGPNSAVFFTNCVFI